MTLSPWYSKKGWAQSLVDVPVRSSDDAREIEQLLADGWQYQKAFVSAHDIETKADDEAALHQAVITATTGDIDRDAEVVDPKGLSTKLFRKNPIIAWGHDYTIPPIGRSLWEKLDNDKLKSLVQFAKRPDEWPEQATWFPDEIFHLVKGGFIKGVSIGFMGTDQSPPTEKELKARPELAACRRMIRKSMLLEISIVPIPANPHALIESVSKGFVSKSLAEQFGYGSFDDEAADLWTWEAKDYLPEPEPTPTKADVLRKILQGKR